jgi:hypothetical protein
MPSLDKEFFASEVLSVIAEGSQKTNYEVFDLDLEEIDLKCEKENNDMKKVLEWIVKNSPTSF